MRAQMGTSVSGTVTDEDLDRHVAELILKEAKQKAEQYGKDGIRAYLPSGYSESNAPKANKRFLSSIIRSTDDHNKTILRAQALAAQEVRAERDEQERRERRARAEEAAAAERLRRLMGTSGRTDWAHNWDRGERADRKRRERSWERRSDYDEDEDEDEHRRHRRRSDRREREHRHRHTSRLDPRRDGKSDRHDEHSHRNGKQSDRHDEHSRRKGKQKASATVELHDTQSAPSRAPSKPKDHELAADDLPSRRPTPQAEPSVHTTRSSAGSSRSPPPPVSSPPPLPPPPPLPSKMDKYFKDSYDPRLDVAPLAVPSVPATGLISDDEFAGWDAMLEIIRQRREDKAEKKVLERWGIGKDKSKDKKVKKGDDDAATRWSQDSLMEIQYKKRGSVREWDLGKDGL